MADAMRLPMHVNIPFFPLPKIYRNPPGEGRECPDPPPMPCPAWLCSALKAGSAQILVTDYMYETRTAEANVQGAVAQVLVRSSLRRTRQSCSALKDDGILARQSR